MAKSKQIYVCNQCGSQSPKWAGQCTDCGAWNSLVEEVVTERKLSAKQSGYAGMDDVSIHALESIDCQEQSRQTSGESEFDRVLGGGLVAGSVILIGGDPGIGKSTLLLQTVCHLSQNNQVLYVTGEESLQQVAMRAKRLQLSSDNVALMAQTHVESILAQVEKQKPQILVIDSIQTLFTDTITAAPGAVSQVRESAARLVRFAKTHQVAMFLVGHVTKDGSLAGPRVLEHMVDTVLYFEGESDSRFRLLRARKNRFGAVNELGIFAMTEAGLKGVTNPSALFLNRSATPVSGSVIMVSWEGSRPLLVEVQALVDESHLANPRRVTVGLEANRLAMLLAVLHRHGHVATYDRDVFANVVGGVRVHETAADLALMCAVLSSLNNRAIAADCVIFGEIGLSGEIRPVQRGPERLQEAAKHGFTRAIVPLGNKPKKAIEGLTVVAVSRLDQAIEAVFRGD